MRRLYRSRTEKKVSGICGGLGIYLEIDPTIIRVLAIIIIFISGIVPGLIGYFIIALIIPLEPPAQQAPPQGTA